MSVGFIIGLQSTIDSISDAWQANVKLSDPYYSTARFLQTPITLNGEVFEDVAQAVPALIQAANESDTGFTFQEDRRVSDDGKIAIHTRDKGNEATIRIGFRNEAVEKRFMDGIEGSLRGNEVASSNSFTKSIGAVPVARY